MVITRIHDPSMRETEFFRFQCHNSIEEAIAQLSHDQARDGRTYEATFWEGDRGDEVSLYAEIKGYEEQLAQATKDERARLEDPEGFDPGAMLAGLTEDELIALNTHLKAAMRR